MATKKKLLQAAAGSAGGAGGLDITDVFSTYLYDGNSSAQTITNGIDLDGEGGLWWLRRRTGTGSHALYDSTRSTGSEHFPLFSNSTNAEYDDFDTTPTSTGFTINSTSSGTVNETGQDYVSWTFRKAPKFFDVVTYTGTGVNGRTVSHSLDSEVGMILVKQTNASGEPWYVYHKSLGTNKRIYLNTTGAAVTSSDGFWTVAPTSTEFSVAYNGTNKEGATYVAYLFAHNDGDGGFGPSSDQDIIKCGSIVGDGTSDREINLGFEPQWLLVRRSNTGGSWALYDNMRGMIVGGADPYLLAQSTSAEDSDQNYFEVTPNGFKVGTGGSYNESGDTYIYMALRRGPLAQPESGTEVFAADLSPNSNNPRFISGFVTDLGMQRRRTSSGVAGMYVTSRLTQNKYLHTGMNIAESSTSTMDMDYMNGFDDDGDTSTEYVAHMWKRAPGFFDVVCWDAENTANRRLKHNLGVIPEMVWIKNREMMGAYTEDWMVYHKYLGSNGILELNNYDDSYVASAMWPSPSATEFGIRENASFNPGTAMIGYFFATLDGISKVGSFTGNGSSQTINCGFTSGARYILIKRTDANGNWVVFDSVRGIGSGNSPYLLLNDTQAEVSTIDVVDPDSSGFIINQETQNNLNVNGGNYIFYAIA